VAIVVAAGGRPTTTGSLEQQHGALSKQLVL
jgi:hypothetical protein